MTGTEIRTQRLALGLTQAQLGEKLGVAGNTVARWERDESFPDSPAMLRLALRALRWEALLPADELNRLANELAETGRDLDALAKRQRIRLKKIAA